PTVASISFDIALFELFGPLLSGGTAMLLSRQHILEPETFAMVLQSVSFLHALPSLMRQFVQFVAERRLQRQYAWLRGLFVGGDVIPSTLVALIQQVFAGARVYVGYGPTEGAIVTTNQVVARGTTLECHLLGRPMANMQVQLYDRYGQLV